MSRTGNWRKKKRKRMMMMNLLLLLLLLLLCLLFQRGSLTLWMTSSVPIAINFLQKVINAKLALGGAGIRAFKSSFGESIDRAKEIVGQPKALRGSSTRGNRVITAEDYDWQLEPVFNSTPGASGDGTPMGGFGFPHAPGASSFIPFPGHFPGFRPPSPWVPTPFPGYVRTFFYILLLYFLIVGHPISCWWLRDRTSHAMGPYAAAPRIRTYFFLFCYFTF